MPCLLICNHPLIRPKIWNQQILTNFKATFNINVTTLHTSIVSSFLDAHLRLMDNATKNKKMWRHSVHQLATWSYHLLIILTNNQKKPKVQSYPYCLHFLPSTFLPFPWSFPWTLHLPKHHLVSFYRCSQAFLDFLCPI